jgi:hypothetical protein
MKKNGKALENLVAVINEALKEKPDTKIYKNHKMPNPNTTGNSEIDVLIELTCNGYNFNIAIECKDHNRPIEKSVIDAFNSKCALLETINKKIVVSSNGFQKGAKYSAKRFNIELYTLSDITNDDISSWLKENVIILGFSNFLIKKYFFRCVENIQIEESYIIEKFSLCEKYIYDNKLKIIHEKLQIIHEQIAKLEIKALQLPITMEHAVIFEFDNCSFKFDIEFRLFNQKKEYNIKQYNSENNPKNKQDVISLNIDDNILHIIKNEDNLSLVHSDSTHKNTKLELIGKLPSIFKNPFLE